MTRTSTFSRIMVAFLAAVTVTRSRICAAEAREPVRIAFGSCLKYPDAPIFTAIAEKQPDAFIFLGDNVYFDDRDLVDESSMRKRYRENFAAPALKAFFSKVNILAVWDDHDFGPNDSDSSFPKFEESLSAFRSQWSDNPPPALEKGIAFSTVVRDVHIVATDNRSFRKNPPGEGATMFGEKQLAWIERELSNPRGRVVVLASGGLIIPSRQPHPKAEQLTQFPDEYSRLMKLLRRTRVPVVVISGDRHHAEIYQAPIGANGGMVMEVSSSPLNANLFTSELPDEPYRTGEYRGSVNFGMLTISGTDIEGGIFNEAGERVLWNVVAIPVRDRPRDRPPRN